MATQTAVSVGVHLLLKMLKGKVPMGALPDRGLIPEKVFNQEELRLYNFIREHSKVYKEMPTYTFVLNHKDFKKYAQSKLTSDPVEAFMDKLQDRHVVNELSTFESDFRDALTTGSISDAKSAIMEMASKIRLLENGTASFSRDSSFLMTQAMRSAVELHDIRRDAYGIRGMSLGLPYVDHVTDGVYPGDFAAIIARPGKGKTYFLLNACMKAWIRNRQPGIIFSYEMPATQLGRRCLGLGQSMNTDLIKKGRVSSPRIREINKWVDELTVFEGGCPLYVVQGSMDSTLAYMEDLVYEKKPKWVGVDAAYLMRARKGRGSVSRTDNVADGAEGLKSLAMLTNVSMIATYQYNRKGGGSLDNIMHSDAVGQVASLVFDIADDKKASTKWKGITSKIFSILKGRDGEQASVRVLFDVLNSSIRQAEVLMNVDTGLSQYQVEQMQQGYEEYLRTNPDTLIMTPDNTGVFSFTPSVTSLVS